MTPTDKLIALAEEHDGNATKGPWRSDCSFVAAARTAWPATAKALQVAVAELRNQLKYTADRQAINEAIAEIDRIAEGVCPE